MKRGLKLVYGVGINNADYEVRNFQLINGKYKMIYSCPFYEKWKSVLSRCYSKKSLKKNPTYKGCHTVPEWHYFMTFRAWMIEQDWQGKELDKDLLFPGNKIYGPDTCVFVSHAVNNFLLDSAGKRGDLPLGATFHKSTGKFQSQCWSVESLKQEYLGLYETAEEAHQKWLSFKKEQAILLASKQTDIRVAAALIDRYKHYSQNQGD